MSQEEHGKDKDMDKKDVIIIVNGHQRTVQKGKICFDDLLPLAFDPVPSGDDVEFTIAYMRGHSNHEDTLEPGDCVEVVEGMTFDVTTTNRS